MEKIISILKEIQPAGEFEPNTMLFESGYVDSFVIFERLLPRLEEIYGILIEPMELVPDNFETPEAIEKYVKGKMQKR